MTKNKFYITTPVYYANAAPHLGSAYTTIAADVLARWHRMGGEEVFFLTGTDEHGGKIAEAAKLEGKSPQEFVDNISAQFQLAWDSLNISNNNFLRTTDPEHIKAVEEALRTLYDKGYFYKSAYKGFYCQDCEQFYTKTELEEGVCPYHQKELKIISEPCYFFKLSELQDKLKDLIEKDKFEIRPLERKNEVLGFFNNQKLEDVAISRIKIKWGIPLPFDKEHTCYVWVDAFMNYLTGLGVANFSSRSTAENRRLKPATPGEIKFWPPDIQLMAKDILRVHATIWPALLLALDLPLPKKLFVHGFFTTNGQKMSKSLGNILNPVEISQEFGVDGLRYYLLAEIPFGKDGDVSIKRLKERYNSDLANGLGNLVSRVLTMAEKYQREVANFSSRSNRRLKSATPDKIANFSSQSWRDYEKAMEEIQFHKALEACWRFIRTCDGYIERQKPWELIDKEQRTENREQLGEIIYNLLESLRHIAWMILPFMPNTSKKIFDQLGIWESENDKPIKEAREWGGLKEDVRVKKGGALFPRL